MFYPLSKHHEFRQKFSADVVFSTLLSVFGYPEETLSLVLDMLLKNGLDCLSLPTLRQKSCICDLVVYTGKFH